MSHSKGHNNIENKILVIEVIFIIVLMTVLCYKNFNKYLQVCKENENLVNEKIKKQKALDNINENINRNAYEIKYYSQEINRLQAKKLEFVEEIEILKKRYNGLTVNPSNTPLYIIENFPTYNQNYKYPNGCESIALYLLLKYNGVDVTPEEIVNSLKLGDFLHYEKGIAYGGDPEIEFVGDPRSPKGWGVYEDPIIDVANRFKSNIIKATGSPLSEILKIVKKGKPVQVWATAYQGPPYKCASWIHKTSSKKVNWYCDFHSMVLIGATSDKVIVSDSLTGKIEYYNREKFEYAYNFYGRRAIYYE